MTTHNQHDNVIATYQILSSEEEPPSVRPQNANGQLISGENTRSSSSILTATTTPLSTRPEPIRSFPPRNPADSDKQKNIITIYRLSEEQEPDTNHTHNAELILGTWKAKFRCKYDEPAGVLHNATVIGVNENMQRVTGWSRQDDRPLTHKEKLEDKRAEVQYGVYKKSASDTVGLCTLKERDDAGWPFLELRTRGGPVGGDDIMMECSKKMMRSIAKRKVEEGAESMLLSVAEARRLTQTDVGDEGEKVGNENGNEDECERGRRKERTET